MPLTCSGIIACVTQSEHVLRMADLRRACSVLLDEAERRFGDEVNLSELPVDYYWTLDLAAAFDMSQTPAEFGCGQAVTMPLRSGRLRGGPQGTSSPCGTISITSPVRCACSPTSICRGEHKAPDANCRR